MNNPPPGPNGGPKKKLTPLTNIVASPPGGHASTSKNSNSNNVQPISTYALALREKRTTPKDEQAIIINTVKEIKYVDYMTELKKCVDSFTVTHAGKLSHNRLCIFFTERKYAEEFIINHGGLNVNEQFFSARLFTTPAQRVVISNVSASIPFLAIENLLKSNDFKLVSPITSIGAGLKIPGFEHIQSFRCQTYIALEENQYLPDSLILNFDGRDRRIYLSKDDFKCFRCGQKGHQSMNCHETLEDNTNETTEQTQTTQNISHPSSPIQDKPQRKQVQKMQIQPQSQQQYKPIETITQSQQNINTPPDFDITDMRSDIDDSQTYDSLKQNTKRSRNSSSASSEENLSNIRPSQCEKSQKSITPDPENALDSVKSFFEESECPPISFQELKQFLCEVKGSETPIAILNKYTTDTLEVTNFMKSFTNKIEYIPLKERVKRVVKKLEYMHQKTSKPKKPRSSSK